MMSLLVESSYLGECVRQKITTTFLYLTSIVLKPLRNCYSHPFDGDDIRKIILVLRVVH